MVQPPPPPAGGSTPPPPRPAMFPPRPVGPPPRPVGVQKRPEPTTRTGMAWQRFRGQTAGRQALMGVVAAFALLVLGSGLASAIGGGTAGSGGRDPLPVAGSTASPTPSPTPVVEVRTETATEVVPHGSSSVDDATLASGTTAVSVTGVDGVLTRTYEVTFTDGVETGRVEVSATVTTPAVNEVIANGTKVDPPPPPPPPPASSCPNGTYTNSSGASVCRPHESSSAPAGATAQCNDGTWSHSQSRRGTCSGHGGVKQWL